MDIFPNKMAFRNRSTLVITMTAPITVNLKRPDQSKRHFFCIHISTPSSQK